MDNNFNRVRLCGRAAGEPELSHINHGESFYRFPLSVERLSGQEDRLPVILPRPLLEAHPVHTGDVLTLTGQLRSFNNRSGQGPRLENRCRSCKAPPWTSSRTNTEITSRGPPVWPGGLSALHCLGRHRPADGHPAGGLPADGGGPGPEPGLHENRGRRGTGAHRL